MIRFRVYCASGAGMDQDVVRERGAQNKQGFWPEEPPSRNLRWDTKKGGFGGEEIISK